MNSEFQPPDPPEHPFKLEDGEWDHNWKVKSDSDDSGYWYWWECSICGEEDNETEVTSADLIQDDDY